MPLNQRILIAVLVLLTDIVIFFLPLAAVFMAYILISNPPWFRDFLNQSQG